MLLSLFYALICHSYFYGGMSVQIICPIIFNCLVCPIIIKLERVFSLDTGPLQDICTVNIFSQSMPCLFLFFIISFKKQGFNFNKVQHIFLSNFYFMVHALSVLLKNCSLPQYLNNFTLRKHEKIVVTLGSMI